MGVAEGEGSNTFLPRLGVAAQFTTVRRTALFLQLQHKHTCFAYSEDNELTSQRKKRRPN